MSERPLPRAEVLEPSVEANGDDDRISPRTNATEAIARTSAKPSWLTRRHWLIALLGYTVLSIIATFPLAFQLGAITPGPYADGDNLWFVWELWAFRQSILAGHDPNHTHALFALLPSVEAFVDAYFNMIVGFFLQIIMSPLVAYNVLVLASFILSGLMMYLLAAEFVTDRLACFCAGFLYTFSTYHFARAAGHFGLLTMQWLPFCAWRLFVFYRRPSRRNAVFAGLGIALVPLSDAYFLAYFLVPFGLLFVLGILIADRRWFANARNLRLSVLAIAIAAAITIPTLIDYVHMDPDVYAVSQAYANADMAPLSADLAGFVLPNAANPLFGAHTKSIYSHFKSPYIVETGFFLGYPAILFGAVALLFRRNRGRIPYFWTLLCLGGIILACGPVLYIAGRRIMPLPAYKLLFGWPFLSTYRAPGRLAVLPMLALAVLSAFGIAALRAYVTVAVQFVMVVLVGFSLAQSVLWGFPYPNAPVHMPALYKEIGADPENALLLDIPLLPSGAFQYYQSVHHKALVYGYVPRLTPRMIASVQNVPYLSQFAPVGAATHLQISDVQGDIIPNQGLKDVLQQNRIKYVVLHRVLDPASYAQVRTSLFQQLGPSFYDNDTEGLTAWRIPLQPVAAVDTYHLAIGSGWLGGTGLRNGLPERDVEQDGQIAIDAPRAGDTKFSFLFTPILKPLQIEIRLNGQVIQTVPLSAGGITQSVNIDRMPLKAGRNIVEFHAVEGCARPSDISGSPDTRCFSISVQQVQIAPA